MPYSRWKLIFDSEKKESARKVLNQCLKLLPRPAMDITLDLYHKGGHQAHFYFYHDEKKEWANAVLEVIDFGQRLGNSWSLAGSVLDDVSGVLSKDISHTRIVVSGLVWANWTLNKELIT